MRYVADNDLHIHTHLSLCSGHPKQTAENILKYAVDNGLKTICVTDHMWDKNVPGASEWYKQQPFERIIQTLPLPQADGIRFLFGAETDLNREMVLGISSETLEKLDFCIIPTTHLHMNGFTLDGKENAEERSELWIKRLDGVLDMDLPFYKIGIAHLTCPLIFPRPNNYFEVLKCIQDSEYHRLFAKAAKRKIGIELNFNSLALKGEEKETELKPYRIAKEEGCKFYFGSDAHTPAGFTRAKENFENIIDLLELTEDDKFTVTEKSKK